MRIAICDDLQEYNTHLKGLINEYMLQNNIIKCEIQSYLSGNSLIEEFSKGFDFVFLDVQMPDMDGFEVAEKIKDADTCIVFVTNIASEMRKGYRYNAKDYLVKPITQGDINDLFDRLISEHTKKRESGFYGVKIKNDGKVYVKKSDILYLESNGHNITAVTPKDKYVFIGKLDKIAEDLKDDGFIRVHQSYLVNMEYIFKDLGNRVVLKKAGEIPISNRYKTALSTAFKERMAKKWNI